MLAEHLRSLRVRPIHESMNIQGCYLSFNSEITEPAFVLVITKARSRARRLEKKDCSRTGSAETYKI